MADRESFLDAAKAFLATVPDEDSKEYDLFDPISAVNLLRQAVDLLGGNDTVPYDDILSLFANILPDLPKPRRLDDKRRRALRARWGEERARQNLEWWRAYFKSVYASDFLMGRHQGPWGVGTRNWHATFDWLINPSNMAKVLEGNYRNKTADPGNLFASVQHEQNQRMSRGARG